MKLWTSSIFSAAILGTLIACSSSPKPETAPAAAAAPTDSAAVTVKKDTLITPKDRYSYALGMDMGRAIKNVDAEIDKELFLRSLSDQMDGKVLLMTDSQAEKALQELVLQMQVTREKKAAEAAKAALDSQKVFLEKNKTVAGVITTASGLQYKYITQAKDSSARTPKLTDKVRVHYAGALLNGTEFDSSIKRGEPLEFPVNAVIKGWQELLTLMKEGEKVQAWIPSELGYGAEGASPVIPPNALLVFEVELLNVVTAAPVVDTVKAVKTPEELKADSIAAAKAAKQAKQDSIAAAKKAKADSIAAVKAAKKAEQDSIKAAKKAKQDSIAAAKKAKQDSIAAAKKAKADSIAAVKAAKKAEQDSIAAAKKAAKKAKQDSIAAVKKAKQDSIAAAKKAKQDSIAAVKKAKADSIAAVKAAKKAEQDSIAAAKKAAQAKPAEPAKAEAAKPAAEAAKPAADTAKTAAPAAKK
ncbi:MAG: FKBP-type peptidyl-prolyl cis-trans isomerase [Fibrobacter sp.]|nr:FKBP-type peptidyl-prolyl cis-trans isomerase [Fibrobacter sp.]